MILIDANIYLEVALGQEKAGDCASLLSAISQGKLQATVTSFSMHAVEAALRNGTRTAEFLENVQNSRGLRVYATTIAEEQFASALAEKIGRDFDDSLQYFVAKKVGAKAIVSLDGHFNRLDLPRFAPREALETIG